MGGPLWAAVDLITPMAVRVATTLRVADAITAAAQDEATCCIAGSACEMWSLVTPSPASTMSAARCSVVALGWHGCRGLGEPTNENEQVDLAAVTEPRAAPLS
jgi:hypothetical protein